MIQPTVEIGLIVLAVYGGLGLLFAIAFHVSGLHRIDAGTRGAGVFFRILITPGIVALWPLLALRWRDVAAGRDVPTHVHRPLSAAGLRAFHRWLVLVLTVVVPVAAGVGIAFRPARPLTAEQVGTRIPQPARLPERFATYESPFTGLPISIHVLGDDAGSRQLELEIAADLEIPTLLLYWSPGGGDDFPRASVFLGGVWGPGTRRYALGADAAASEGTLVLYSLVRQERIASFTPPRLTAEPADEAPPG